MPTQGQRQNYLWRPNDNSATTRLRYDLEAEHWVRSVKSAEIKYKPSNLAADLAAIGLFVGLVCNLISIVLILLIDFFKFIYKVVVNKKKKREKRIAEVLKTDNFKNNRIEQIIADRPKTFHSQRSNLFKKAATIVVVKQVVSISNLMYELGVDFEKVSQIIDELYDAGIISDPIKGAVRNVFIKDKKSLDLFFQVEKSYHV
ncbi:DNA translocase FtsK [Litoribaculum gwangyangense]|uniref:FtsK gamma domain-containing protein n=1 Tax=Litoribaculum gwangyangense TaxID=1130722 RepID=A0ABP9C173_9FLAO